LYDFGNVIEHISLSHNGSVEVHYREEYTSPAFFTKQASTVEEARLFLGKQTSFEKQTQFQLNDEKIIDTYWLWLKCLNDESNQELLIAGELSYELKLRNLLLEYLKLCESILEHSQTDQKEFDGPDMYAIKAIQLCMPAHELLQSILVARSTSKTQQKLSSIALYKSFEDAWEQILDLKPERKEKIETTLKPKQSRPSVKVVINHNASESEAVHPLEEIRNQMQSIETQVTALLKRHRSILYSRQVQGNSQEREVLEFTNDLLFSTPRSGVFQDVVDVLRACYLGHMDKLNPKERITPKVIHVEIDAYDEEDVEQSAMRKAVRYVLSEKEKELESILIPNMSKEMKQDSPDEHVKFKSDYENMMAMRRKFKLYNNRKRQKQVAHVELRHIGDFVATLSKQHET
jgi:hypothetical protein